MTPANPTSGAEQLLAALRSESVHALGQLGREVETTLAALRAFDAGGGECADAPSSARERARALHACAHAVWRYFVQREALGLRSHDAAIAELGIPAAVLARVGASPPADDPLPGDQAGAM